MKKVMKTLFVIGGYCLAASLIPYCFKTDKATGSFEISALLWSVKKAPGEGKDTYTVELLPMLG